jgi:hypothetical protein
MKYHLVCVVPFGNYAIGQKVTDEADVARLLADRDLHFVRVPASDVAPAAAAVAAPTMPAAPNFAE